MDNWKLADAKNRLSEVIERAEDEGVQTITRRGRPVAIVMSFDEFTRMSASKETLADTLLAAPRCSSDDKWNEIFS